MRLTVTPHREESMLYCFGFPGGKRAAWEGRKFPPFAPDVAGAG